MPSIRRSSRPGRRGASVALTCSKSVVRALNSHRAVPMTSVLEEKGYTQAVQTHIKGIRMRLLHP